MSVCYRSSRRWDYTAYALPMLMLIGLCGALLWKYYEDLDAAQRNYEENLRHEALEQQSFLEQPLNLLHQELRSIANLPDIRAMPADARGLDANIIHIIRQTFDTLADNVGLSALYIISNDMAVEAGEWRSPILVSNPEFHFNPSVNELTSEFSRGEGDAASSIVTRQLVRQRVALLGKQLALLREQFATLQQVRGTDYPAAMSFHFSGVNTEDGDWTFVNGEAHEGWLLYTVPFYGRAGELKGVIAGVQPLRELSDRLVYGDGVIIDPAEQIVFASTADGLWREALQWVNSGQSHPGLFFSHVHPLRVAGNQQTWLLWSGRSSETFWVRTDVRSARYFATLGFGTSILLALALAVFIRMSHRQRRFIVERNAELETRVEERTAELQSALSAARAAGDAMLDTLERHHAVFNNAKDGIITIDEQGRVESFNPAAERAFGYKSDEMIGENIALLMPEPFHCEPDASLCEYVEKGESGVFGHGLREVEGRRKDGTVFPVEIAVAEMRVAQQRLFLGVVRDISKRKQDQEEIRRRDAKLKEAEQQLMQSEKMASVGQLAAGVAHEINNPIGYINSNLGTLEKYIGQLFQVLASYEDAEPCLDTEGEAYRRIAASKQQADMEFLKEDVAELVTESQEGIRRVKQIVQDLKDFSHVDQAEWQVADLHQGLDSTLNIVRNEIKYKAEVVKHYAELPEVECIPSQLNQVFMNLFVNAAHAIEKSGVITVATGREGEGVWVEVGDTGKGIAKENLKRIFDPFFTTKPVGSGTGLGLSLSYGIINKHHGSINVDSEVGKGTRFRIWLPIRQHDVLKAAS